MAQYIEPHSESMIFNMICCNSAEVVYHLIRIWGSKHNFHFNYRFDARG